MVSEGRFKKFSSNVVLGTGRKEEIRVVAFEEIEEAKRDFYNWLNSKPEEGGGLIDMVLLIEKWFGDKNE